MSAKKILLWFYMFSKRLLLKWSFVLLLISIPLLIVGINYATKSDSGILTIHLCADKENTQAAEVINGIMNQKTTILFKKSTNLDDSLKKLENNKIDAVWYFENELFDKIDDYAKGKTKKPFVKVFEREDTIALKLSREKLFGGVFGKISYSLYKDFVYSEFVSPDAVSEDVIKSYIGKRGDVNNVVLMETINGENIDATTSYLIAPLRGLLALIIMLCGFAAALVFIEDRKNGKFDWLASKMHFVPAFAQCFAGVLTASVVVLVSLFFTNIFTGIIKETVSMVLFAIASSLFCVNLCMIFKSASKLGATIPALVIGVLALSPVFFNISVLNGVKLFIPTCYYLNFVCDTSYFGDFVLYIVCAFALSLLLVKFRNFKK